MYVRLLIGRQAGQIVEMPYHAASSNVAMGTAASVTDEEMVAAGFPPSSAPRESEPEAFPPGYRVVDSGGAGFEVLGPDGAAIHEGMLPNLAAARSLAEALAAAAEPPVAPPAPPPAVVIPEGWKELSWAELLALGKQFDAEAKTKEACQTAIQAELDRRAGA